ncbi:MAG: hybrid sensor histidine kinase/response regulator, partial [Okeania sp. SIO3B3]|nr:hybrid sensor histidine kinase/response regulator [Okeania sp. SIO3B3]
MTSIEYADKSVLIVDDSAVNLGVLVDYLQDVGFRTFTARDGEVAIERTKMVSPNIILLDIMMPGIDGFETCRRLKANAQTADIPVIFMTALNETKDKVAGFAAGAVDYITKPIQQEELLARMDTHLRIYDLTVRLQSANEQLTQQAQELSASNATKDRLFSIIAHDLRGLFLPLLGFTDLLSLVETYKNTASAQRMAERAHGAAQSIYLLLERLLKWANLQQGQIPFQPDCIAVHHFV